jgi:hypothetical protein
VFVAPHRSPITLNPKNATSVIKALTCLHNFLLVEERPVYMQHGDVDVENPDHSIAPGRWELGEGNSFFNIQQLSGNRSGSEARDQRIAVANFFMSRKGMVSWQFRSALISMEELEEHVVCQ